MSIDTVDRWSSHARRDDSAPVRPAADSAGADESLEFVRFCYRRRQVAWPTLYDEMCAVAARGAYRGLGYAELAEHGIHFSLDCLPRLAALAQRVMREEQALHDPAGRDRAVPMMLVPQPART